MDFLSKILHRNVSEGRTSTDPEVAPTPDNEHHPCSPVTKWISPTFSLSQPPTTTADPQVQGSLASDSPKATRVEEEVHNQSTYTGASTRDRLAICTHVTVD